MIVNGAQGVGLAGDAAGDSFQHFDTIAGSIFTDTVSAAGFSSGVTIDLDAGTFDANGITIGISGFEAAVGSGYADSLVAADDGSTIEAGGGDDTIAGSDGVDSLTGGYGDDSIVAGDGDDTIDGGAADLAGSDGADILLGGDGADTFLFRATDNGSDVLPDLEAGDRIVIDVVADLSAVTAAASITAAYEAVFTPGNHLLIDADGDAAADLDLDLDGTGLTASDFTTGTEDSAKVSIVTEHSNSLVNGLGGSAGFGEGELARGDDSIYASVDITAIFGGGLRIGESYYTSLYVNTNGHVTFSESDYRYFPSTLDGSLLSPSSASPYSMIAGFWSDIDTRNTSGLHVTSGGTSTGSNAVYYDVDTDDGTFTATWDDVGQFSLNNTYLNAFQIQIVAAGAGAGDFDIVLRYEDIEWARNGNARAGVVIDGDGFELPASGNAASLEALEATAGNAGSTGIWRFEVRNGELQSDLGLSLTGSMSSDSLQGGDGADTISGSNGEDTISGGVGPDLLYGGNNGDSLVGGLGDDTIVGGNGADVMAGGDGDDLLSYNGSGNAALVEVDSIDAEGASGSGAYGDADGDYFEGFDRILVTYGGADTIVGGDSGAVAIDLEAGTLTYDGFTIGIEGFDVAQGDGYDDTLTAAAGGSALYGGGGNDSIVGGEGEDHLYGGIGDDTVLGGDGDDTVYASADNDLMDGGGDDNLADFSALGSGESLEVNWDDSAMTAVVTSGALAGTDTLTGFAQIAAGDATDDTLFVAGSGAKSIEIDGFEIIDASASSGDNDFALFGQLVDGSITGGSGEDSVTLAADYGPNTVTLADVESVTVEDFDGGDSTDVLTFTTSLAGASIDLADGDEDEIVLAGGTNSVNITGVEIVTGSCSADALVIESSSTQVTVDLGDDKDSLTLGTGAHDVVVADVETVTGSSGDDTIRATGFNDVSIDGGEGDDYLAGGDDDDTIYGGDGDDTIEGGGGADCMVGESDSGELDTLSYGDAEDAVSVNVGSIITGEGASGDGSEGDADGDTFEKFDSIIGSTASDDTISGDSWSGGVAIDLSTGMLTLDASIGISGFEVAQGGGYADTLTASDAGSTLIGEDGDDILNGGSGNDALFGGEDDDTIFGGIGDDTIEGGDGADSMVGDGDGGETDTLSYAGSSDAVSVNVSGIDVNGASGDGSAGDADGDTFQSFDTIVGSAASNDTISGESSSGGVAIYLSAGSLSLDGYTIGFSGFEIARGGDYDDTLTASGAGSTLIGGYGDDQLSGGYEGDALFGGGDDDTIYGGIGDDTIEGGDGADSMVGDGDGGEQDTLSYADSEDAVSINVDGISSHGASGGGSAGDADGDTFETFDAIIGSDSCEDTISGNSSGGAVAIDLAAGTLELDGYTIGISGFEVAQGGDYADTLTASDDGSVLVGGDGNDDLRGGDDDDELDGDAGADVLAGGDGDDTLDGGSGDDTIEGGAGSDDMTGSGAPADHDTLSYAGSCDAVSVKVADIDNTGASGVGSAGDADGDFFQGFDAIIGSDDGEDTIAGASLTGGIAIDLEAGSIDLGSYSIDISGFEVAEGGSHGDTLTASDDGSTLIGGDGDDALNGGDSGDALYGGDGEDTLIGGLGNDTIDGGDGADSMVGNGGAAEQDTLSYASTEDPVYVKVTSLTAEGAFGIGSDGAADGDTFESFDTIVATTTDRDTIAGASLTGAISIDLGAGTLALDGYTIGISGFEVAEGGDYDDTLTASADGSTLIGGDGDDMLYGGDGADCIAGLAGNDTVQAGDGDDTVQGSMSQLLSGGEDSLDGGSGTDELHIGVDTATAVVLGDGGTALSGFEKVVLYGGYDVNLTFADGSVESAGLIVDASTISGGQQLNLLFSDADQVTLMSGSQDNVVSMGGSNDTVMAMSDSVGGSFNGGGGNNTADFSELASAIAFDVYGGAATLAGGNNLTFTGFNRVVGGGGSDTIDAGSTSASATLSGGEGDDLIIGGSADDTLTGESGTDTLTGGSGNDLFVIAVGAGTDYISDLAAGDMIAVDGATTITSISDDDGDPTLLTIDTDAGRAFVSAAGTFDGPTEFTSSGGVITVIGGPAPLTEAIVTGVAAPDEIEAAIAEAILPALTGGGDAVWELGATRTLTYSLWGEMSADLQAAIDRAFDAWEALGIVQFVQVDADRGSELANASDISVVFGGALADRLLGGAAETVLGAAFRPEDHAVAAEAQAIALPATEGTVVGAVADSIAGVTPTELVASRAGDVILDDDVAAHGLADGDLGYYTILHEIGHALGLADPGETPLADALQGYDHADWTVMSFNIGDNLPAAPGALDILALHQLYGGTPSDAALAVLVDHIVPAAASDTGGSVSLAAAVAVSLGAVTSVSSPAGAATLDIATVGAAAAGPEALHAMAVPTAADTAMPDHATAAPSSATVAATGAIAGTAPSMVAADATAADASHAGIQPLSSVAASSAATASAAATAEISSSSHDLMSALEASSFVASESLAASPAAIGSIDVGLTSATIEPEMPTAAAAAADAAPLAASESAGYSVAEAQAPAAAAPAH